MGFLESEFSAQEGHVLARLSVFVHDGDLEFLLEEDGELFLGILPSPLKVTRKMSKKKVQKRSRVKPFVKYVNYNHIMPTRYQLPPEIDSKTFVTDQQMDSADGRKEAKQAVKEIFQEK